MKTKKSIGLEKVGSRCLFLDEVIDIRFIDSDFALLCTNSETLKLLHIKSGEIELYPGHSDIILCLDVGF